MCPKSNFGHPGVRLLRFWEDLIKVRFLMIFWAVKKMKKIWKHVKRGSLLQGSAELPLLAEELLESAKSEEFVRVCKESGTPCPLRAGGGGLISLREFRWPYFLRPGAFDLRGFLKQPPFENFYQNRPTMAPHSAKNGINLAQWGWQGVLENKKRIIPQNANANNQIKEKLLLFELLREFLKNRRAQRLVVYYGIMKKVLK